MLAVILPSTVLAGVVAWGLPAFLMRATVKWGGVPLWLTLLSTLNVIYAAASVAGIFGLSYGSVAVDSVIREAEERCLGNSSGAWNLETFRDAFHAVAKAGTEDLSSTPTPERGGMILPITQEATRDLLQRHYAESTKDRLLHAPSEGWKLAFCRLLLPDGADITIDLVVIADAPIPIEGKVSTDVARNALLSGAVILAIRAVGHRMRIASTSLLNSALWCLSIPAVVAIILTSLASWLVAYKSWGNLRGEYTRFASSNSNNSL